MAQPAESQHPEAALQRHLQRLHFITPQQQELTLAALCQGVAARDPAWVQALAASLSCVNRPTQQQLAAQPGLLKDLAGYLVHIHLESSAEGTLSAGPPIAGSDTTCSSSGKHHWGSSSSSSSPEAQANPSSGSRQEMETSGGALAHLLQGCEPCAPPLLYQDLAPALHAALQQRLVCLPALAQSALHRYSCAMASDPQLLGLTQYAAEQGEEPAVGLLACLGPLVLRMLENTHPANQPAHHNPLYTIVHERIAALLAGSTSAGAAFLAAAVQEGGTLWQVSGTTMVEAACSGLRAACCAAGAVDAAVSGRGITANTVSLADLPPAHAVCLQYLRGLLGVVLHLAPNFHPAANARLAALEVHLVPALAEALSLLLEPPKLPDPSSRQDQPPPNHQWRRPYHDAAWGALLALSERPATADLVAALFQHQPGLLEALAASWGALLATTCPLVLAEVAARLAAHLLRFGSIPGQHERRQHQQLLVAAVRLWDRVWPEFWHGQRQLVLELIQSPHGPAAVAVAPNLRDAIFKCNVLGDDNELEGWARLFAAPEFDCTDLVRGVRQGGTAYLLVVERVWHEQMPALITALLAIPGLADALAQCCSMNGFCPAVDACLAYALDCEALQASLEQQPVLLQALLARLRSHKQYAHVLWECLAGDDIWSDWVLQQPVLLDGVVAALVVADGSLWAEEVLLGLLGLAPSLVHESLLRQPSAVEELLRVLVRGYWQATGQALTSDTQYMLLEGLANPQLAQRALVLLPGLLAKGDAELSTGVFEAMHFLQMRLGPGSLDWGVELAATSSGGAAVMCAEGQLQALRRGVGEAEKAAAAAAAATQQLREQQQAAVAAAAGSKQGAGGWLVTTGAPTAPAVAAAVPAGGGVPNSGPPHAPKRTRR